ncbi:hypothetical protein HNQ07_000338 [Deinococcus metalli]|uniref:Uncharacterized protein n=1 Tax=Deinococcus metalli TaxID=1141878 RepID=A0A7W8KE59_9DEIO|nr:hypothetical protein [Deinococcus metalli]MBB5374894.1 hypothetical protein [Deinococcus metalli]GHF32926.1 hypothetical protein GCM10017781_07040 [Deinococcus metalli]
MSAITRPSSRDDGTTGRDDPARAATGVTPHPSWRFHDRYDLWVDWLQREHHGWTPYQSVVHRTFRSREETLLHAERFISRGEFPMQRGAKGMAGAAPVTLLRNRRDALLTAFRQAEGDGVTLIREVQFPIGEYALSVKVTCERIAGEVRATFGSAANPLRSLAGKPVKLTRLIEHPYDVLGRAEGTLELLERGVRLGGELHDFAGGVTVTGVPYQHATVAVPRGLMKKPLMYRYEVADAPA